MVIVPRDIDPSDAESDARSCVSIKGGTAVGEGSSVMSVITVSIGEEREFILPKWTLRSMFTWTGGCE
jgi:hypothetical protein